MSDNYSLIIKNGSCYIDGKLIKSDIGLHENKIKKISKSKFVISTIKFTDLNSDFCNLSFIHEGESIPPSILLIKDIV